jgi:hypothetical protein
MSNFILLDQHESEDATRVAEALCGLRDAPEYERLDAPARRRVAAVASAASDYWQRLESEHAVEELAAFARGLEQLLAADDVGTQDVVVRILDALAITAPAGHLLTGHLGPRATHLVDRWVAREPPG